MRTFNVILNGARGGQGTSTVAAALALYAAGRAPTQLVAPDAAAMAALLGLPETSGDETQVADRLTLSAKPAGEPVVRVIDASTGTEPASVECDLRLVVLRGPCYVALRSLVRDGRTPAGLIVLQEPGRSLSERDVHDVTGVPVVATIAVTAAVARTVDAGLFIARLDRLRDLAQLRRYATDLLDLHAALSEPQDNSTAPISTVVDGSTRASDTLSNVGTELVPPPVIRLRRDLEMPRDFVDILALGQQPAGLAQLSDHLLRRVPASLHRGVLPAHTIVGEELSHQADQLEGLRSLKRPLQRPRKRRHVHVGSTERLHALRPNHVWAIDFEFDETSDQRRLKIANIVDECTVRHSSRESAGTAPPRTSSPSSNGSS